MAMASSRNETASFSSSSIFTLTTRSSSPLFSYRSPPSPPSPTSSLRLSSDNGTPSVTVTKKSRKDDNDDSVTSSSSQKRSCMCSPTTHPGSFRCAYHKRIMEKQQSKTASSSSSSSSSSLRNSSKSASSRLNLIRLAMKNSLVKIGVEGEILRKPLTTVISYSSHQLRRREKFQPRLSRLSIMSKAQES